MRLVHKKALFFTVSAIFGVLWMKLWLNHFIPHMIRKHQEHVARGGQSGPFRFSRPREADDAVFSDAFLPADFAPAESELLAEFKRDRMARDAAATPAPTLAPTLPKRGVVTPGVRRTAVEAAWRAPGDMSGPCATQALVANADALGQPCDVGARFAVAESREDVALASRYFCRKRNGTFVEVGAVDGLKNSVTHLFEKALGWRGLLIEGQPASAERLRRTRGEGNRVVAEAVCRKAGTAEFLGAGYRLRGGLPEYMETSRSDLARGGGKWRNDVPCRPFGAMLRDAGYSMHRGIDLAVVDVSGGEHVVLETMDWDIPVRVWLVASPAPRALDADDDAAADAAARANRMLAQAGYRRSTWDIAAFCAGIPALNVERKVACSTNAVWEHPTLVLDMAVIAPGDTNDRFRRPWACCGCEALAAAIASHVGGGRQDSRVERGVV